MQYASICGRISVSIKTFVKNDTPKEGRNHMIYAYCRVSTPKQNIERQIQTMKEVAPDAIVITEKYTGTTTERPEWSKLQKKLKAGDVVYFEEVSRMSRNADEGFKLYKDLYDQGVSLKFVREPMMNTENFRSAQQIATVGEEVADIYIEATNKVLMILAERQIRQAFEAAEIEVESKRRNTSQGVRNRIRKYQEEEIHGVPHEKMMPGRQKGSSIETQKSREMKEKIRKMSKKFSGTMNDRECMEILKLARNTYYKYVREMRGEEI